MSPKLYAKVLYDFAGSGKNEMALKVGSTIEVVQKGPKGGWSKGSLGAFPTDYVQFLEGDGAINNRSMNNSSSGIAQPTRVAEPVVKSNVDPFEAITESSASTLAMLKPPDLNQTEEKKVFAVAKFSRAAAGPTELSIERGDTILLLNNKDKDWWYGSVVGKSSSPGYFPSNYVEIKDKTVTSSNAPATSNVSRPLSQTFSSSAVQSAQSTLKPNSLGSSVQQLQQPQPVLALKSYQQSTLSPATVPDTKEIPSVCKVANLVGYKLVFQNPFEEKSQCPAWKLPLYLDLFADAYFNSYETENYTILPVLFRIRTSLEALLEASKYIDLVNDTCSETIRRVFDKSVYAFRDAIDVCKMIPVQTGDMVRLYTFLVTYTVRVKSLRPGDFLIVPVIWSNETGEFAVFLLLMKEEDANFGGYSVSVINACDSPDSGIGYHLPSVNTSTGFIRRKLSFNFRHIPDEKVQNTAFW